MHDLRHQITITFWRFAAERQAIFFRRFHGEPCPWTDDTILQEHKFTNAYRASDRVSQYRCQLGYDSQDMGSLSQDRFLADVPSPNLSGEFP